MENTLTATTAQPVRRGFLARLVSDRSARIWLFTLVVALAALLLYEGLIRGVPAPAGPVRIPWWGIAVLFLLAEAYPVHLHFRTEAHSLSLSEIALVLGLFLTAPGGLIAGQLCGAAVALIVIRRQRPLKAAFNLAQFTFGTCLALVIFHAVSSLGDPFGTAGWTGALAGAAAFGAAGVALVSATISLAEGRSMLGELPYVTGTALVGSVAGAALAIAAVELRAAGHARGLGPLPPDGVLRAGVPCLYRAAAAPRAPRVPLPVDARDAGRARVARRGARAARCRTRDAVRGVRRDGAVRADRRRRSTAKLHGAGPGAPPRADRPQRRRALRASGRVGGGRRARVRTGAPGSGARRLPGRARPQGRNARPASRQGPRPRAAGRRQPGR